MKLALTDLKLAALLAIVMAAVPVALHFGSERAAAKPQTLIAHSGETHEPVTQTPTPAPTPKATAQAIKYDYVAQPNDSYSLLARKAVQTYGSKSKTTLTQAQIIFAETHLTLDASSPKLKVGQKVSLDEAKVKQWVEKATALTESQKKAWDAYARYADFNTDSVGQAK